MVGWEKLPAPVTFRRTRALSRRARGQYSTVVRFRIDKSDAKRRAFNRAVATLLLTSTMSLALWPDRGGHFSALGFPASLNLYLADLARKDI